MVELKHVKAVVLDCDGVLTDGKITFDGNGVESRTYDMQDGMGLTMLRRAGLFLAVVSSSSGPSIAHRMKMLKIEHCYTGVSEKAVFLQDLAQREGFDLAQTAFVGDDLVDLAPMAAVGYPIAVQSAVSLVKKAAVYVTRKEGGNGAVREIAECIVGPGAALAGSNLQ